MKRLMLFLLLLPMVCLAKINPELHNNSPKYSETAGCPKKIVKWINQVNQEYPGENLNLIDGDKMKTVVYNLYSDKYFIPIFKKPFDQISTKQLEQIYLAGRNSACKIVIPGNRGEVTEPAKNALGRPSSRNFSFETTKTKIAELKNVRATLDELTKKLDRKDPTVKFDGDVTWWESKLRRNSQFLLPSEVKKYSSVLSRHKKEVATRELLSDLETLLNLNNEYNSLERIATYTSNNREMYTAADTDTQEYVTTKIKEKTSAILGEVLPKEINILNSLGQSEADLKGINAFAEKFNEKYKKVYDFDEVKEVKSMINLKKLSIIEGNKDSLATKISEAKTFDELEAIKELYLSQTNFSDKTVTSLIFQIKRQRSDIADAIKERELEEAKRREEEARRRKEAYQLQLKEKKQEALNQLSLLANQQSSLLTPQQFSRIKEDLRYRNVKDESFSELVKLMSSKNGIYLVDINRKTCSRVFNIKEEKYYVEFQTAYSELSKLYFGSGRVEYVYNPEKGAKILSPLYYKAKNCYNYEEYYSPVTRSFKINKTYLHDEIGATILWNTLAEKGYCSGILFYEDCRTDCVGYVKEGATNHLFVQSKSLAKIYARSNDCN